MSPSLPSTFYYTAAILNALTIPKHILVGIKNVQPAVDTIPPKPELARTKSILVPTWESCNMFLVGSALLNLKWARSGPPTGIEEKLLVWSNFLIAGVVGWKYFKCGMWPGLFALWIAPALDLVATFC